MHPVSEFIINKNNNNNKNNMTMVSSSTTASSAASSSSSSSSSSAFSASSSPAHIRIESDEDATSLTAREQTAKALLSLGGDYLLNSQRNSEKSNNSNTNNKKRNSNTTPVKAVVSDSEEDEEVCHQQQQQQKQLRVAHKKRGHWTMTQQEPTVRLPFLPVGRPLPPAPCLPRFAPGQLFTLPVSSSLNGMPPAFPSIGTNNNNNNNKRRRTAH